MLNQILLFTTAVQEEYPTLPNYKKIVRLFELYRTLKENNLCDIIDPSQLTSIGGPQETTIEKSMDQMTGSDTGVLSAEEIEALKDNRTLNKKEQQLVNDLKEQQ